MSINVTGPGDHVLIPGEDRYWITLTRVLLTVACPANTNLGFTGKADAEVKLGPFYMQNGGTLSFDREQPPLMRCGVGEALVVNLDGAGTIGGTIIIERGQV